VSKVYFLQEKTIQVHQTHVQPCPSNFPAGYYWYGSKRAGPGCPPRWVDQLLATEQLSEEQDNNDNDDDNVEDVEPESEPVQTNSNSLDNQREITTRKKDKD